MADRYSFIRGPHDVQQTILLPNGAGFKTTDWNSLFPLSPWNKIQVNDE